MLGGTFRRIRQASIVLRRGRHPVFLSVVVSAALIVAIAGTLAVFRRSAPAERVEIPREVAALDLKTLRRRVGSLEAKVRRLAERRDRLFPAGSAILVDTAENRIYLLQGAKVVAQDKCSAGSGLELTETGGKRTWTFETPRGHFPVLSKVTDPVWIRPDWAFVEQGEAIPKDRASRAVPDVLGDYALAFGDGYFIHGTLYTRMLGANVTHGCIRVDDDTLKKLYQSAHYGTSIWIY